jgi:hypothetical protein
MASLLNKLRGKDRRSIGRAGEVAREISCAPKLLVEVFEGLLGSDPVIRMRAADAIEKATRDHPELLKPFKRRLLRQVAQIDQAEVRWHVAQMLPRLQLTPSEHDFAISILFDYLEDQSSIVRTCAMQALADLAVGSRSLRSRVIPVLELLAKTGSPALRSRGRRLLVTLRQ